MRDRKILQVMHLILFAVLLGACGIDPAPADGPIGEAREAFCGGVLWSVPSTGGPAGTSVVWNATVTTDCGIASPEYEFWVRDAITGAWSVAQPYSATSTYTWTVPSVPAGSIYNWQVWVRDAGSTASFQTYGTAYFEVDDVTPCTSVSTSTSPSFVSGLSTVAFSSSATGCTSPEYEVWVLPPAGSWTQVSGGYTTSPEWHVDNAAPGTYDVQVWARAAGSTASYEAWTGLYVTVNADPTVSAAVSPAHASDGTQVTISMSSTGLVNPEYEVWYLPPEESWQILQPYSASTSCVWDTTGALAGTYQFQVWAREQGDGDTNDAWTGFSYGITVLYGSFTISNTFDEATLDGYTELTGNLYIDAPGLPSISLPNLTKIDGAILGKGSGGPDLVKLSLPALTSVGSVLLGNDFPALTTLSAPVLTSVGPGGLGLSGVAAISAPDLATIGGDLSVSGYSPASGSLSLPALASIGGNFTIGTACSGTCSSCASSTNLTALDFASLVQLGSTNGGTFTVGYEPTLIQACVQGIALQLQAAGWTGPSVLPPCTLASGTCP